MYMYVSSFSSLPFSTMNWLQPGGADKIILSAFTDKIQIPTS